MVRNNSDALLGRKKDLIRKKVEPVCVCKTKFKKTLLRFKTLNLDRLAKAKMCLPLRTIVIVSLPDMHCEVSLRSAEPNTQHLVY